MPTVYLLANAALYFGLAAWCTIAPDRTSRAIGFRFDGGSARSEYIVIYGGLELALAIVYLAAGLSPEYRRAGVLFSLVLYACLALYRGVTLLVVRDLGTFPYAMFAVEAGMAVWGLLALRSLDG